MNSRITGILFGLALAGAALAQHHVAPTTVNGVYDQTQWTPIAIGSCSGNGTGCTKVYGFDWLSDGRMVLLTNDYVGQDTKPGSRARAKVSLITNPGSGAATVQTIASHFKQPAGVAVLNDTIWVSDMDTVYIIPNNNPTPADTSTNRTPRFRTPLSTDYNGHQAPFNFAFNKSSCHFTHASCNSWNSQAHHYIFTPVYYQGKFYAAYGDATGAGNGFANLNSSSFYGSALLTWDNTTTELDTLENRAFAGGFRSPNGTALGPGGSIFVSDHNGSWVPMETITLFKVGAPKMQHGGYRLDPGYSQNFAQTWYERGDADYVPPMAINRYKRTTPQSGWTAIGQPYYLTQGPYAGQLLVGMVNSRGLWRVALDTLPDTTGTPNVQGAVFVFTPGNSSNTLGTGNAQTDRITQGPDGTIYAGGGRGIGNWAGGASQHLIYVFKPAPIADQFEVMNIRSLNDGYELYLSQKVDPTTVTTGNFTVGQRNWVRQSAYGLGFSPNNTGGDMSGVPNFTSRSVTGVAVSDDSLRIRLQVSNIRRINQERRGDSVTHWHTRFLFDTDIKSVSGNSLYTTEADYAQNWISTRSWDPGGEVVATKGAPKASLLDRNVWLTRSPGVLRVNVDNMTKPYDIALRDLKGRVVFGKKNIAPGVRATEIRSPGASQAVYTVEVLSGSDSYRKIVTF